MLYITCQYNASTVTFAIANLYTKVDSHDIVLKSEAT